MTRVAAPQPTRGGADALLAGLRERVDSYVPGWQPKAGAGEALLVLFAQMLAALAQRIDRAPDKNELAFLDLLGLELLAAQPARAPIVLTTAPALGDGRAPARSRFGATPPGASDAIVFETEQSIALVAAQIAEVWTVFPGRDACRDHSAEAASGAPFTLWHDLTPLDHELYLAHGRCLKLAGSASVEIDVALGTAGSEALKIAWTYWDGELWRDVAEMRHDDDTTVGLTRSGTITVRTACAAAQPIALQGLESYWLRGRLVDPLPPGALDTLPAIDRVRLRTVLERTMDASGVGGLLPDAAFAGAQTLDVTKPFQPLGPAPGSDAAFYVACEEAFTRPEALVSIFLDRPRTAQEQADDEGETFANIATAAMALVLQAANETAEAVVATGRAVLAIADANQASGRLQTKIDAVDAAITALVDMSGIGPLATAAAELADVIGDVTAGIVSSTGLVPDVAATQAALRSARDHASEAAKNAAAIASWIEFVIGALAVPLVGAPIVLGLTLANQQIAGRAVSEAAQSVLDFSSDSTLQTQVTLLNSALGNVLGALSVPDAADQTAQAIAGVGVDIKWRQGSIIDGAATGARIQAAKAAAVRSARDSRDALEALAGLSVFDAAAVVGQAPPELDPPVLAWEYWDGGAWSTLPVTPSTAGVENLMGTGTLTFTAPSDWESNAVGGTPGHWLRARIAGGVFGKLRLVTWIDSQTKRVTLLPMIEPRPPEVRDIRIGYRWAPAPSAPEHCLTHNDFRWIDATPCVAWRGEQCEPFVPTDDTTPAFYVGVDKPLPADRIGVYLGLREDSGDTFGPPLVWEAWDGTTWRTVTVEDGTRALAVPGIVDVLWPGGDDPLARFGTMRTWLRARLRRDGDPRHAVVDAVALNAVWAAQAQTIIDEVVGTSSGEPRQTHFLTRTPVLRGEVIEVRELDGPRAAIEWPMLRAELAAAGVAADDVRINRDPQTGRETEIWVPWSQRPNLLFSGPGDRHYAIERTRGRLVFGDGVRGRIPPAGPSAIRARRYRAGGGTAGNVSRGTITQALSGVITAGVTNPRAADGGADGEPDLAVLERAPRTLRNYRQAMSADDWEALALEASPAVALARALPATRPGGLHAPGWVTVMIVPHSTDPEPEPSVELRHEVLGFLLDRAPAALAG
ncbi:MAG: baseplate J/gp47 family protein, partial [Ilumatobacteraceae bacterium]